MDRAAIERLLGNAVRPAETPVTLPTLGQIVLRRPSRTEAMQCIAAAGDEADQYARAMVNVLRFALVDETGRHLLRSFAESAAFFNAVPEQDLAVLVPQLEAVLSAATADTSGDLEAGKAS